MPRANSTRWPPSRSMPTWCRSCTSYPNRRSRRSTGMPWPEEPGLMAACDFAVASETARIGCPELFRGLVPAVVMYDLTRLIGDRRARQLLLAGELIMATQAYHWGLVNQVTTPDRCLKEAIRVGKDMIKSAPQAVAAIKRLLDETQGRPKSLRGAAAVSAAIRVSEEAQEGIRAFLEKRPPRWVETHL